MSIYFTPVFLCLSVKSITTRYGAGGLVIKFCPTLATPVAQQAPLSMEFSRQKYWSGVPFPSPGDLHDPGIEPRSPVLQADSLPLSYQGSPLLGMDFPKSSHYSIYKNFRF